MLRKLDLIICDHPQLQMLWQRGREISISFCLLSTPEVQTQGNSVTPRELDDQYYSAVATSLRPNSSFWVPSYAVSNKIPVQELCHVCNERLGCMQLCN